MGKSNADRAFLQMCEDQALVEKREAPFEMWKRRLCEDQALVEKRETPFEMWKRRKCEDQALVEKFTQTTDEQSRLIKEADDEQHMKDCFEVSSFP